MPYHSPLHVVRWMPFFGCTLCFMSHHTHFFGGVEEGGYLKSKSAPTLPLRDRCGEGGSSVAGSTVRSLASPLLSISELCHVWPKVVSMCAEN